jgi:glycerophosphoryl diester phosphodiesterase
MSHLRIYGHRGSPREFPENTVESFEAALAAGADGFETDLRCLSDRTLVLFHDDELGGSEIETLTFDQCSKVGRVRDLAQFAGRATMILEVKRAKWEEALLAAVEEWPNIIVSSFDHRLIAELARREVKFPLGIVYYGALSGGANYATSVGAHYVFPSFRYVDRDIVDEMHAADVQVVPWTANRERDWELLRDAGCDGIITDNPRDAVAWRDGLPNL